jgi:hypothetical protein
MRRLQFQLRRNTFPVQYVGTAVFIGLFRYSLEDGRDGPNGSTSPASGNPNTTLAVPQPGDNVDPSQPAYPLNSRTEVSKNYIIHETSEDEIATRPPWKDTMAAMFGNHVKWEDMKAYVSRGHCKLRIPYRILKSELYSSTRSITGRPARYVDPRTNVPYATPTAYRILTMILNHEYVWSHALVI